jgi:hypothetical protein
MSMTRWLNILEGGLEGGRGGDKVLGSKHEMKQRGVDEGLR